MKVSEVFNHKKNILNIYITAGFPTLGSTITLIEKLDALDVDLIEVGIPYSDPLADGTTIQQSSELALKNGMNLALLFEQIASLKDKINTPLILMGYYNQMLQFGPEKFLQAAQNAGVSAFIIPDLPMPIYEKEYKDLFQKYNIEISFLITPFTSDARIIKAAELSTAFVYMVSQTSITGNANDISEEQIQYFERINAMNLATPRLIGFGIHDKATFDNACEHSSGAIIGSALIRALKADNNLEEVVTSFVEKIRLN
jgi:tryptophan synthase alpha chain